MAIFHDVRIVYNGMASGCVTAAKQLNPKNRSWPMRYA
jgi:hypothetical protein